jgi:hypothetical protein
LDFSDFVSVACGDEQRRHAPGLYRHKRLSQAQGVVGQGDKRTR